MLSLDSVCDDLAPTDAVRRDLASLDSICRNGPRANGPGGDAVRVEGPGGDLGGVEVGNGLAVDQLTDPLSATPAPLPNHRAALTERVELPPQIVLGAVILSGRPLE